MISLVYRQRAAESLAEARVIAAVWDNGWLRLRLVLKARAHWRVGIEFKVLGGIWRLMKSRMVERGFGGAAMRHTRDCWLAEVYTVELPEGARTKVSANTEIKELKASQP